MIPPTLEDGWEHGEIIIVEWPRGVNCITAGGRTLCTLHRAEVQYTARFATGAI